MPTTKSQPVVHFKGESFYLEQDDVKNDVESSFNEDQATAQSASESTDEVLTGWPNKSIRDVRVDIRDRNENVPQDRSEQLIASSASDWNSFQSGRKVFAWCAPNIRY